MKDPLILSISESSQVAEARRNVAGISRGLGFNETEIGKVSIIATELATNLVKHGGKGGQLIIRSLQWDYINGLEILSLDRGPGIENLTKALQNGYSTRGSPGTGLGAIQRLSSLFDVYSIPGFGTAVMARLWSEQMHKAVENRNLKIGAILIPRPGEEVFGDAWGVAESEGRNLILIADGLGHGRDAAQSANEAVKIFKENQRRHPAEIIGAIHGGIKHTRGAAVAVAEVDTANEIVRFSGVGNISGLILSSSGTRHFVSHNGTVGMEIRKIQEFTYPWPMKTKDLLPLLIMHSDGLATHWEFNRYPGLVKRHPSLIAGILYRDFRRGNDDVAVVVAKPNVD